MLREQLYVWRSTDFVHLYAVAGKDIELDSCTKLQNIYEAARVAISTWKRINIQWWVLMGADGLMVLVRARAKVFFSLWRVKPELHLGKISVCLFASDKLSSLESPMLHRKNSHGLVGWGKLRNVLTMDCLQTLADVYNVFFASFFAKSWAVWHFSEVYGSGCYINYINIIQSIPRPELLFQGLCRTGVLHAHRYLPVPRIRKDESLDSEVFHQRAGPKDLRTFAAYALWFFRLVLGICVRAHPKRHTILDLEPIFSLKHKFNGCNSVTCRRLQEKAQFL